MNEVYNPVIQSSNARPFVAIAVIVALAAVGLNFNWRQDNKHVPTKSIEASSSPDTIIEKPILDGFNETGKKVRQLRGEKIQFFESDKRSIVTSPDIHFEQQGNDNTSIPWRVTANTATAYQSNNKIELQGNALLQSHATDGSRTEIATEQLFIDTAKQFAETNKAVTIRSRNSEANANGMQADLANKHLVLLSRVKEIHEVHR
jgi:LPS export ABC transporter protein LptC